MKKEVRNLSARRFAEFSYHINNTIFIDYFLLNNQNKIVRYRKNGPCVVTIYKDKQTVSNWRNQKDLSYRIDGPAKISLKNNYFYDLNGFSCKEEYYWNC